MFKNKKDWKKQLTKEVFYILWEKGTEPPFSGKLYHEKRNGTYHCAGCHNNLFKSVDKFDSGSGWPSFSDVASRDSIILKDDNSFGKYRIEVLCKKCGGHLGHVFDNGPISTRKRYCMNSLALTFEASDKKKKNINVQ